MCFLIEGIVADLKEYLREDADKYKWERNRQHDSTNLRWLTNPGVKYPVLYFFVSLLPFFDSIFTYLQNILPGSPMLAVLCCNWWWFSWFFFIAAYTQIITLTVYTYLCSHLFGRQFLEPKVGIILKPEDQFVLLTFSKWAFINDVTHLRKRGGLMVDHLLLTGDLGSNPGKGWSIWLKRIILTFELLRCSYSDI